jgi:uncharacterized protein (TIGR03067 family)
MNVYRIRSAFARIVGLHYRELLGWGADLRQALEETLDELHARKYKECGTPAYELNNEYFRIGRQKLKVSTEDEMDVSLWGPKSLVEEVYNRVVLAVKRTKMKTLQPVSLSIFVALALTTSCSTPQKPAEPYPAPSTSPGTSSPAADSDAAALQGTWKGKEIGGQFEGDCFLIIKGNELEYRGADPEEWYKGTFTLRENTNPKQLIGLVLQCPAPGFIGKNSLAIYRIDGRKLFITGHEPGDPEMPTALDAPDARRFVLEKQ